MNETHPIMKLFEQEEQRRAHLKQMHELVKLGLQQVEARLQQKKETLTPEELSDLAQALYHYWEIMQSLERVPGIWKNDK